jgi:nucleoid DNA-binding protein
MSLRKSDIIKNIASKAQLSSNISSDLFISFIKTIKNNAHNNKVIKIFNFGTFQIRETPQRFGRNPLTLEPFLIKKRKKLFFSSSKKIKNIFN